MPKILAVDDKQDNLIAITALLKKFIPGCEVVTAQSGMEGIEKAGTEQPDTILLDSVMPGKDGYEVCRALKSEERTGHIPVILTAMKRGSESRLKGLECGAEAFLRKPIDAAELAAQVKAMLRIKRAEDRLRAERSLMEERVRERSEELRESEARFKGVFEYTRDGVAVYRAIDEGGDFVFVDFNRSAETIEGIHREELIGRRVSEVFPGIRDYGLFEVFQRVWKTGRPEHFPIALYKDERMSGWRDNFVYRLPSGEIVAVYSDETGRMEREAALREKEARFRALVESAHEHIFMLDRDGTFLFSNEWVGHIGLEKGTGVVNRKLRDVFAPAVAEIYHQYLEQVLDRGEAVEFEHTLEGPDGIYYHLTILYPIFQDGEIRTIGGICRDISERKRSEEELRKSEEKFFTLFKTSPVWIAFTDLEDGRFLEVNDAFTRITGFQRDEVLGRTSIEVGLWPDPGERARFVEMVRAGGGFRGEEVIFRNRDGEPINLLWSTEKAEIGGRTCLISVLADITDRLRAESALRESEERYRTLIQMSPSAVLVIQDGVYVFANPTGGRMLGLEKQEDILGLPVLDTIDPAYRDLVRERMERALKGMSNPPLDFRLVRPDGTRIDTESVSISVEFDGRPAIMIMGQDITDRKRAEKALQESEARFRLLFEKAPLGYQSLSEDGCFIEVNQTWLNTLGYAREEVIGRPFTDFLHRDWVDRFDESFPRFKAAGEISGIEFEMVRKDGSPVTMSIHGKMGHDLEGRFRQIHCILLNITEQKKTQEEIRKFKTITDRASYGAVIADPEGRILYVNDCFAQMHGYAVEELLGRHISLLFKREQLHRLETLMKRLLEQGNITAEEVEHARKDGTVFPTLVSASVIGDDREGRPLYLSATAIDTTEKSKIETRLKQVQKMEAIGTLAGGIAHDFNNILGVIIGYGEMMEMFDVPPDSPMRPRLVEVLRASHRAKDLVQQILTFSRQTELERKPVQLAYIVKETLKFLRASLPTTIEIRQHVESKEGAVLADPTQMHQILMNLCTNAAHAMREGGGILDVALTEIELNAPAARPFADLLPGPYLKLAVSDTGCGMKRTVINRIFDPYYTTKEKGEGTGLGLSVVHGIVKSSGGAITVNSEPGKGSTFEVFFPRIVIERSERDIETAVSLPGGKERILFVDDEKPLIDLNKRILEKLGYAVEARTGSIEALDAFRANPNRFDMVITDQTMPNMTGTQLAEEFMKIRPEVPIILCTGFSEIITPEKAESIGIQGFLMKPLGARDLAETVRKVLDRKKPAERE